MVGVVKVLLVSVSFVFCATNVSSIATGNVKLTVPDVFLSVPPMIKSFTVALFTIISE